MLAALFARSSIQPEKEFAPTMWQLVEHVPPSLLGVVDRINAITVEVGAPNPDGVAARGKALLVEHLLAATLELNPGEPA